MNRWRVFGRLYTVWTITYIVLVYLVGSTS
jgi:hypothetical protein